MQRSHLDNVSDAKSEGSTSGDLENHTQTSHIHHQRYSNNNHSNSSALSKSQIDGPRPRNLEVPKHPTSWEIRLD
jgi:hypothetical protein